MDILILLVTLPAMLLGGFLLDGFSHDDHKHDDEDAANHPPVETTLIQ